jgi:hypothetical protein
MIDKETYDQTLISWGMGHVEQVLWGTILTIYSCLKLSER